MIKILLLFLLISTSMAQDMCLEELQTPVMELGQSITEISEKSSCQKKSDVDVVGIATGCLSGGKAAVTGAIDRFVDLMKFLVVEAPSYLFKEAKEKILMLMQGEVNPVKMASAIASINLSSQKSLWELARSYWESFSQFAEELKEKLYANLKNFSCLPEKEKFQIICKGVTQVFLMTVSPQKFLEGAKWGLNTARALKNFIDETQKIHGLKDLSLAGRLDRAAKALGESVGKGVEVLKLRNATLSEVVLPTGEKILQYEKKVKGADGKVHVVKREVPLDAKTGAIDSNSAIGKEILNETIKAKAGSGSLVFVDINYLGKVNYYKKGTQGGDQYLESVAESLRKSLRPGDMVFKNGGDELVVVLGTNNPQAVKAISQRMMNEVDQNPNVREIFRQEVSSLAQKYRDVNKATKLDDIPEASRKALSSEERKLAETEFKKFQDKKKKELLSELQDQATYRGSVSVGSTIVKHDEELGAVLARAEKQAAQVKTDYKARYGHDVSKYNTDVTEASIGPRYGPPVALDPL